MEQKNTPIETARQTLMQLMQRKLPPTPDNFRSVYDEIMGVKSIDKSVELAKTLEKVLLEAGKQKPKYIVVAQAIAPLIEKADWSKLEDQLRKLFPSGSGNADVGEANWSVLIRSLLKQLEVSHKGVTLSRKKEGLSKVLTNFANDPDVLAQKILALINSWGTGSATETVATSSLPADGGGTTQVTANALASVQWREMLLRTFELVLIPHLQAVSDHQQKAISLLTVMRQANGEQALTKCANDLKPILLALEMERDHQARIHEALTQLLRLLVTSMGSLVLEDQWLYAQTIVINDIISKPLNINTLYDAESSLKELTYKQSQLKPALTEAKDTLKKMVTTFVDRLVEMTESTSDYHDKIEGYQQKIASTEDMGELNVLLNSILEDTRAIGLSVQRTRDEFTLSQKHAMDAEKRIQELTAELDYIGEVAHQDYLTGALNRRGMDEAIEREFNRADRHNTALCVAMLDIDHFKKLNDSLGHATGDQALTHLVRVLKDVLRPTDVLARYGGEEFAILIHNCVDPAQASKVAERLRIAVEARLVKSPTADELLEVTVSIGIAMARTDDTIDILINRADECLYQAKMAGRNCVVVEHQPSEKTDAA